MPGSVRELNEATFQNEVLAAATPVLVEFWAPWCAPCKAILPVIQKLAGDFAGKLKVCRINTDENPAPGLNYQVKSIPTYLLFAKGAVTAQVSGARARDVRAMAERAVGG